MNLHKNIKFIAKKLGFSDCRFAKAEEAQHREVYFDWLDNDFHADMAWLARDPERRSDPRKVLPKAKTVIVLGFNYFREDIDLIEGQGRIARYAWGEDYHKHILWRLQDICSYLEWHGGNQKPYVDTGPILERDFASKAGLGWNGKSCVQIHRKLGTYFFLATIITTLEIKKSGKLGDGCGSCTLCIDACPTDAILRPHVLDSRKCISYLTIENKGEIPLKYRRAIGDRIYGCDECLDVCPWNRFASASRESFTKANDVIFSYKLVDFLEITDEDFIEIFRKSPIRRIKRPAFIRNVCVALGNIGTLDDISKLEKCADIECDLVSEHAMWAISEIKHRLG